MPRAAERCSTHGTTKPRLPAPLPRLTESEEHFKMNQRSQRLGGETASSFVELPLSCKQDLGRVQLRFFEYRSRCSVELALGTQAPEVDSRDEQEISRRRG
jgi:hypothetical protein